MAAAPTFSYTYAPNTQTATFTTTATCPPATGCASGSTTMTTGVQWRRLTFDGFGRTIKVETGHDSNVLVNTVDTVYGACGCSPLGKVIKTSMPYGPGETEVWTTYTYDASGRQLTSTAPDGSVTTTSYSGNSVTTTDPAGIWKTNVVDAFGNLSAVNEPDPATGSSSTGPVTNYTYNGANQLTNVSMTRSGITQNRTFAYNGSDLISETTPEAGTVAYTYDNNHHVLTRIDALNQKTQYSYDSYERLTLVQHYTWGNPPGCLQNCLAQWNEQAQQDVSYYYDTHVANDYTQTNTWGRLSAVVFHAQGLAGYSQPDFAYEYNYNQAGRVIGNRMLATQGTSHVDLQGQYAWDNQGRMTSLTYPSGPVMTTQFDAMGRPSSMSETACVVTPANPQCSNYTWTASTATFGSAGQLLTVGGSGFNGTITASLSETRTYNNMLQLTHLVSSALGYQPPNTYTGGGVDIQYVYNTGHNNGRVAQTIDNTLGETVNYSYDYLHRLTAATATNGTWGEAYTYDGFGNLTGKTPTQGYAPAMTGSADSNATGGALSGQWDVEKRPMTQGVTQATPFYVYDPWGRRVWRQWYNSQYGTTNCEAYFYGATGQKLESYSCQYASGSLGATLEGINTYFAGKMLSEKGVFIATDRLGSVRGDSNGVTMSYYPWGEERGQGTADNRTKFAGYYRDMPGQDYANARYYSASSGSFWSPDPGGITTAYPGDPSRWNRYAYVSGDPVNKTDPSGFCSPQDNPPCFPVNSAPLPAGPTPGSPVQGNGGDAPPVDLGGDNPDPPGGGQDPSAVYTAALFSAFAALKDPACAAIFNTNPNSPNQYDPGAVLASMAFGGTAAGIPSGTYFGSIGMAVLPFSMAAITQPDRGSFTANGAGGIALSADIVLQGSTLAPGYYGNDTPQQTGNDSDSRTWPCL